MRVAAVVCMAFLASGCFDGDGRDRLVPSIPCPEGMATTAFDETGIIEASGITRSTQRPCTFWVHNDSGGEALLYEVDGEGGILRSIGLDAEATDWEDIASTGPTGLLIIGDIGNNLLLREYVEVHVAKEPAPDLIVPALDAESLRLTYPAQPFDAEAMAYDRATGDVLILSKGALPHVATPDPLAAAQGLYSFSLDQALDERIVEMQYEGPALGISPGPGESDEFAFGLQSALATGMDISPDGSSLAVLTYGQAYVWHRSGTEPWADVLVTDPMLVPVPREGADQMEGIAFSDDGAFLLITDEEPGGTSQLTIVPAPSS